MAVANFAKLSACPECGAEGRFQYVFAASCWRVVESASCDAGAINFDFAPKEADTDFQGDARYESELLECSACFHQIAVRPEGYGDWHLSEPHMESMGLLLEQLVAEFCAVGARCDSRTELADLCRRGAELLRLAGRDSLIPEVLS